MAVASWVCIGAFTTFPGLFPSQSWPQPLTILKPGLLSSPHSAPSPTQTPRCSLAPQDVTTRSCLSLDNMLIVMHPTQWPVLVTRSSVAVCFDEGPDICIQLSSPLISSRLVSSSLVSSGLDHPRLSLRKLPQSGQRVCRKF